MVILGLLGIGNTWSWSLRKRWQLPASKTVKAMAMEWIRYPYCGIGRTYLAPRWSSFSITRKMNLFILSFTQFNLSFVFMLAIDDVHSSGLGYCRRRGRNWSLLVGNAGVLEWNRGNGSKRSWEGYSHRASFIDRNPRLFPLSSDTHGNGFRHQLPLSLLGPFSLV